MWQMRYRSTFIHLEEAAATVMLEVSCAGYDNLLKDASSRRIPGLSKKCNENSTLPFTAYVHRVLEPAVERSYFEGLRRLRRAPNLMLPAVWSASPARQTRPRPDDFSIYRAN